MQDLILSHIILSPISIDELETRLINRFKSEIQAITPPLPIEEELLTSRQTAKVLGVSLVTLHKWKIDGKVKFYRIGTRIRFKKSEVLESLKSTTRLVG